ncbi:hypothetical protein B6U59_10090, partial [Ligilactobacillus salivarius]
TVVPGDNTITVTVKAHHTTTTETKTVNRTVKIYVPGRETLTTNQTVTLTRTVDRNDATDETTPGEWSTDHFTAVDVPTVPGYTADRTVPAMDVNSETPDTTVEVHYTANTNPITIKYVDEKSGQVVNTVTGQTGKTGETIAPKYADPNGYDI